MSEFQILLSTDGTVPFRPIAFESQRVTPDSWSWADVYPDGLCAWPSFEEAEAALNALRDTGRYDHYSWRIGIVGDDVSDLDWRVREKLRFGDGTYKPTPWHNEAWYQAKHEDHFCHVSTEQPGKIAFTENDAKGQADRQLVMSPGRYLNRFFSEHLDNNAIEGWCAKLSVLLQEDALKITQDADEIEQVYVNGPRSCMAHGVSSFDSPVHPVRVYAGPDTALAYIGSSEDAKARCVVWPERKIYTRIYGDVSRLRLLLEAEGYKEGELDGARIQRIEYEDCFVVPYIDRGGNLADAGDYLVIGHGDISSGSTSGLAERPWQCPHCWGDADRGDAERVEDANECWCDVCVERDATYCHHASAYYSNNNEFVHVNGRWAARTVLARYAADFGAVYIPDRDEWWRTDMCFECDACGEWFHQDNRVHHEGETLCDSCVPDPLDDSDEDQANAHVLARQQHLEAVAAEPGPVRPLVFRVHGVLEEQERQGLLTRYFTLSRLPDGTFDVARPTLQFIGCNP